jgi:dTDP-D-glucose 4,6-dehydratase
MDLDEGLAKTVAWFRENREWIERDAAHRLETEARATARS